MEEKGLKPMEQKWIRMKINPDAKAELKTEPKMMKNCIKNGSKYTKIYTDLNSIEMESKSNKVSQNIWGQSTE